MRTILVAALAMAAFATPVASHAQVIIQAPPIVGGPYWRGPGEGDWRRRREVREEYRREHWRRDHCVRDFRGEVYCRR